MQTYARQPEGWIDRPWWVVPVALVLCIALMLLLLVGALFAAGTLGYLIMALVAWEAMGADEVMVAALLFAFLLITVVMAVACGVTLDRLLDPQRWRADNLAHHRCPCCKYDLRHLPEPRCPECGFAWGRR